MMTELCCALPWPRRPAAAAAACDLTPARLAEAALPVVTDTHLAPCLTVDRLRRALPIFDINDAQLTDNGDIDSSGWIIIWHAVRHMI